MQSLTRLERNKNIRKKYTKADKKNVRSRPYHYTEHVQLQKWVHFIIILGSKTGGELIKYPCAFTPRILDGLCIRFTLFVLIIKVKHSEQGRL